MTPLEWESCADPVRMLRFLHEPISYRLSSHDRQLFAVACCRRVWDRLDALSRRLVEVAEQYANGRVDLQECRTVYEALRAAPPENTLAAYAALGALMCPDDTFSHHFMYQPAADAAYRFVVSTAICSAALVGSVEPHGWHPEAVWDAVGCQERAAQCDILRRMVAGPFRS